MEERETHNLGFLHGGENMYCMSCGAALPDDAAFCLKCGAKLTGGEKPNTGLLHAMRCTACGSGSLKRIRKGEYRCEHCGTLLHTDEDGSGSNQESVDAKVAILLSEAAAFAEKKDDHNELRTLTEAMELAPENNTVLLRLGRAYWRLGSFEKAMECYRAAEERYPEDPTVYTNIAAVFFKSGHYAEAKAEYEKAVAIIVSNPASACAEDIGIAYGNYAYCLGKLGDKKNAKKYLSLAKEKGYSKESVEFICRDLHLNRFLI